jgi:hypothetical protein
MSNRSGGIYGFTGLFPLKAATSCSALRSFLRSLDNHPLGSPLSSLDLVHMARLVIIDRLAFQGEPAAQDHLMSAYLLFACDFDGAGVDDLTNAMAAKIPDMLNTVWRHCVGFPDIGHLSDRRSELVRYFRRCQIPTNLFLADQPDHSVLHILQALALKRMFADFVQQHQGSDPEVVRHEFHARWHAFQEAPPPAPGSW